MKKLHLAIASVLFVSSLFVSRPAMAEGWSWGLGYHNPPGATVGLNFMHLWTNWAFEIGLGYIGTNEAWNDDEDVDVFTVAGDLNLKYLFGSGDFRPYLQGGFGAAVSTSDRGSVSAGTSLSDPFGGAGFFVMGSSVYMYASYLFLNASTFQVGVGFWF